MVSKLIANAELKIRHEYGTFQARQVGYKRIHGLCIKTADDHVKLYKRKTESYKREVDDLKKQNLSHLQEIKELRVAILRSSNSEREQYELFQNRKTILFPKM